MKNMLKVAEGFQYSVNIGFDLYDSAKLKNFIPTKSALQLLEEILLSTDNTATDRARVLVGAYGKGKSHIVLTILALLMRSDLRLFSNLLPKLQENPRLHQLVQNYYASDKKILPVVITGSNTSIPQAFLLALQRTLAENDLLDVMPETNYNAACKVISKWKADFPATYEQFVSMISLPVDKFMAELQSFNVTCYEEFERLYPQLTAGSVFNPFLGFDVIDLYENAVKGIKSKGYTGMYIVYDEFSKFLEANITQASISDTKMLQDFAEKCNRSGAEQLHLLLISHKEIANYIDKLPKQKLDGWRGVSERFSHIHLNNNFTQTYEIIASVISKDKARWQDFCNSHREQFTSLMQEYAKHALFADLQKDECQKLIYDCYPLHPVSTFILPRLSERVAQNERTLFTFLSAKGSSTLASYLQACDQEKFSLLMPDQIYDYFEPLLKKEVYSSDLHDKYKLATIIIDKLAGEELQQKIVKVIALIYMLEQYEKLAPTKETIIAIYKQAYGIDVVTAALDKLIEDKLVIYLKKSNQFLRLKRTSGVNVLEKIHDCAITSTGKVEIKSILNYANVDKYIYPFRYNDEKEMVRYFSFEFIGAQEVTASTNWQIKREVVPGDGVIYAIIPDSEEDIARLQQLLLTSSANSLQCVFVLPKKYREIEQVAREMYAAAMLREAAAEEPLLFDEYDVVYEDLCEVANSYIADFTHPERYKADYYYNGSKKKINRKAALTGLLSDICETVYPDTPIINNEAINKDELTTVAANSRNKIMAGLLRNELEPNLGLNGSGQEVSIMRSTLVRTGILASDSLNQPHINLQPEDKLLRLMLAVIVNYINSSRLQGKVLLEGLYKLLTGAQGRIGLRRGVIPIYLAAVFHEYKQQIIIEDKHGQVTLTADVLQQINAAPQNYTISCIEWDAEKNAYIESMAALFADYVVEADRGISAYDYVAKAMKRWYMALPKYSKESKSDINGEQVLPAYIKMQKLFKQNLGTTEMLFTKLPEIFGYKQFTADVYVNIKACKDFYDAKLATLKRQLVAELKQQFILAENREHIRVMSLSSIIKDWCDSIENAAFEELFTDGTDKCLAMFKAVTNDEDAFITKAAKLATGLHLDDWDDNTVNRFREAFGRYQKTAKAFKRKKQEKVEHFTSDSYQLTFVDAAGGAVTKRFAKVEYSKRGKLLLNAINAEIEAMGQAITEQEKRQILMEILQQLC